MLDNSEKIALLSLICCLVFGAYILAFNGRAADPSSTDFYKFYKSARFFIEGKSIYTPVQYETSVDLRKGPADQKSGSIIKLHPNLNSPLHTLIVLPFSLMPFGIAYMVWSLFSLGTGLFAVHLVIKHVIHPESTSASTLLISLILMAYYPSFVNILLGQYGFIVLLCSAILWLFAREEKSIPAGIVLGLALSIKIYFGFFLVFFAARRQWRLMLSAISAFLAFNLLGLSIFGLQNYYQYLFQHSAIFLYLNASWNASILAFVTRIFGGAQNIPLIFAPKLGYSLAGGIGLLLVAIVFRVSTPRNQDTAQACRFDLGFSLSLIAMLLISPYAWIYYFPCLIIPLLVCWRVTSNLKGRQAYRASIVAIWILSSWPTALISSDSPKLNDPAICFTSAGYYHYSLLAFSLMLILLKLQIRRR